MKTRITIIGLVLLCSIAINSGAEVNWKKYSYSQNWGGLNDNLSTTEIADNESTDLQNIIFDTGGAIKKRNGYVTIPNTPSKVATGTTVVVNGLFFLRLDNGNRYLVALANNDTKATLMEKPYVANGGPDTNPWVNIDNAGLSGSYTNNLQPSFAVAQNVLVFTDGVTSNKPYQWTGTGKSQILTNNANLPNASMVVYHKRQLFLTGNNSNPSRVYFSNLDDIYTYTSTDFFDVDTSDGSQVRALISAFDSLYIFKDKSIWRLAGTNRDDFTLQEVVRGIGTMSNASVKVVNNLIYFTTQQNDVAVYDGAYNVEFISKKIRGTIGGLNFQRNTNTTGLAFSSYKYVDYDYYMSASNGANTTNDTVLVFDTAFKAWTKFSGINANCWTVGDNDTGQNAIYFGDYSGYVHRYPSSGYYDGNVATSAISAYYQSKWFKYSEVALGDKYWRLLKTYALSNSGVILTAECKADYEASGKVVNIDLSGSQAQWDVGKWDVDLWGGDSIIVGRNEIEKGTNMFQIKFSNNIVNQGFTLIGYENFIEPAGRI